MKKERYNRVSKEFLEKGKIQERKRTKKGIRKLKSYIKNIMWENAHDVALLEDLLRKIDEVFKEDLKELEK